MAGRKRSVWSTKEVTTLREMFRRNATDEAISEALGRTLSAVRDKRISLGIHREAVNRFGSYSTPPRPLDVVTNPDAELMHLRLIAEANNGKGFPFFVLPAAYRVAA